MRQQQGQGPPAQGNETALAIRAPQQAVAIFGQQYKPEELDVLMAQIGKNLTPAQFCFAVLEIGRMGLDPLADDVAVWTDNSGKLFIMPRIDSFRAKGQAHQDFAGIDGPYWCGKDGQWTEVWVGDQFPVAAKFSVFRHGFPRPFVGIATQKAFRCENEHKLALCAERMAYRRAYPALGRYMPDEGAEADTRGPSAAIVAQIEASDTGDPFNDPSGPQVTHSEPEPEPEPIPLPADDDLPAWRKIATALYRELGGDPSDRAAFRDDLTRVLARDPASKEPLAASDWRLAAERWQRQLAGPAEGEEPVVEGEVVPEPAGLDEALAPLKARAAILYRAIGIDPDNLARLHEQQRDALGSHEEHWTAALWAAWVEKLEALEREQLEVFDEPASPPLDAEPPAEDPFEDGDPNPALSHVQAGEQGMFAQQSGL